MAKQDKAKGERKRRGISLRMDADLLDEVDEFCESQDIPIDRTAFIEVACRRLLDAKKAEQKRNGH